MKNIVFLRHAKSSWDFPLEDINRPLLPKGIDRITKFARKDSIVFETAQSIFCSPAARAIHTALILIRETKLKYEDLSIDPLLYTFSPYKIEKYIYSLSNSFNNVILVGHNPAFTEIITKFSNSKLQNLPTASWAKIKFLENKWNRITKGEVIFGLPSKYNLNE
tara:strand:- start:22535 stop:23026 length:492 start_codon:yes stop_codon:yes gene_type:complete